MADNVKNFKKHGTQIAVWENKGKFGPYATVDISRSYKDKEDEWKVTKTLRPLNLKDVEELLPEVKKYILSIDPKAFEKKEQP